MADKDKSGIEMLRKLAEDVYDDWSLWSILKCGKKAEWGGDDGWPKISDALRSIADQIEREHAEELAAAKRGLTDEARVAASCSTTRTRARTRGSWPRKCCASWTGAMRNADQHDQ